VGRRPVRRAHGITVSLQRQNAFYSGNNARDFPPVLYPLLLLYTILFRSSAYVHAYCTALYAYNKRFYRVIAPVLKYYYYLRNDRTRTRAYVATGPVLKIYLKKIKNKKNTTRFDDGTNATDRMENLVLRTGRRSRAYRRNG
jgi:hypothetical protein